LGGPDEVWVFAEKNVEIRIPGRFVEAPVRTADRHQVVVVFNAEGEKDRISIPENGPTFHTNVGRIFRQADGFYLMQGASAGYHRSMFRWSKDRFELMPLEESEEWLKKVGLDTTRLPEFDPTIDQLTEANGWKHLWPNSPNEESFAWNDLRLKILVERGTHAKFQIMSTDPVKPLDVEVFAFESVRKQITREESDEMFKYELPGHRKP
jgi:hypothetical protein